MFTLLHNNCIIFSNYYIIIRNNCFLLSSHCIIMLNHCIVLSNGCTILCNDCLYIMLPNCRFILYYSHLIVCNHYNNIMLNHCIILQYLYITFLNTIYISCECWGLILLIMVYDHISRTGKVLMGLMGKFNYPNPIHQ